MKMTMTRKEEGDTSRCGAEKDCPASAFLVCSAHGLQGQHGVSHESGTNSSRTGGSP